MFTIKKYSHKEIGYTAYACKSYTTHFDLAGRRAITLDADENGTAQPRLQIVVDSEVFIENGLGKTIEHFLPTIPDLSAGAAIGQEAALRVGVGQANGQIARSN